MRAISDYQEKSEITVCCLKLPGVRASKEERAESCGQTVKYLLDKSLVGMYIDAYHFQCE
jgi:hypothetical protein